MVPKLSPDLESLNDEILRALVDVDGKDSRSSSKNNANQIALCGSNSHTREWTENLENFSEFSMFASTNTSSLSLGQLLQGAVREIALITFQSLFRHLLQIFENPPVATQNVSEVWHQVHESLYKFQGTLYHSTSYNQWGVAKLS